MRNSACPQTPEMRSVTTGGTAVGKEEEPSHCTELRGAQADRLDILSAHWGRRPACVALAIALTVLARQAVDRAAQVQVGESTPGRIVLSPDLTLHEVVHAVSRLIGDATNVLVTTSSGESGLPEHVRLRISEGPQGTLSVHSTCGERLASRLRQALQYRYEPSARVSDVPLVCQADLEDLHRWAHNLAPIPATTLDRMFSRIARSTPGKTAVSAGGQRLTYGQAEALATRLANVLVHSGVQLGEPVVVVCDNALRAVVDQLAVLKAGAVCIPVGPVTAERALEIATLSGARTAICSEHHRAGWEQYCRVLTPGEPETERAVKSTPSDRSVPRSGFTDVAYLLVDQLARAPMGAQLSAHEAWVSAAASRIHRLGHVSTGVAVCDAPWERTVLSAMWWAFACGATLHWYNPANAYHHGGTALHLAAAQGMDMLFTPEQYGRMLDASGPAAEGRSPAVVLVKDPCSAELAQRHFARMPDTRLLTEFSADGGPLPWTAAELDRSDGDRRTPPNVGRPSPNVHVKILDEAGRALPPGYTGELYAEGSALPCEGVFHAGAVPQSLEGSPVLRSGRLARLRMDGSIELADTHSADATPRRVPVRTDTTVSYAAGAS